MSEFKFYITLKIKDCESNETYYVTDKNLIFPCFDQKKFIYLLNKKIEKENINFN